MKKLVIFGNSIFDKNSQNRLETRFLRYEIQRYENTYHICPICELKWARELGYVPESFGKNLMEEVDLIQVSYSSTPRGAHSIIKNPKTDIVDIYKPSKWGGYGNNIYIPVKKLYLMRKDIEIIATKIFIENGNYLCGISTGNGGVWEIYVNFEFERDYENIKYEKNYHKFCILNLGDEYLEGKSEDELVELRNACYNYEIHDYYVKVQNKLDELRKQH